MSRWRPKGTKLQDDVEHESIFDTLNQQEKEELSEVAAFAVMCEKSRATKSVSRWSITRTEQRCQLELEYTCGCHQIVDAHSFREAMTRFLSQQPAFRAEVDDDQ